MKSCPQFAAIKLVALDVDGVLTDGRLFYGPGGEALKAFQVKDGSAIKRLASAGIEVALITARESREVSQRATELGIKHCYQGVRDKLTKLRQIQADLGLRMEDTLYAGDDWLDEPCLAAAGLSVTPADAVSELRARADYVTRAKGGEGVVSEIAARILAGQAPVHVVIPARYGSSRFPGKPLALLKHKPMIQWVIERPDSAEFSSIIVATDDQRIAKVCEGLGAEVVMTSASHASGTDRLAEVARIKGFGPDDIVVNLQGDEPLLPKEWLGAVCQLLRDSPAASIATLAMPCASLSEARDPNVVKVVKDDGGRALYFSRSLIPFHRDANDPEPRYWKHIGLYAYRARDLAELSNASPNPLELSEKLEQLRALALGWTIAVGIAPDAEHPGGVDTPEDLARLESWLSRAP